MVGYANCCSVPSHYILHIENRLLVVQNSLKWRSTIGSVIFVGISTVPRGSDTETTNRIFTNIFTTSITPPINDVIPRDLVYGREILPFTISPPITRNIVCITKCANRATEWSCHTPSFAVSYLPFSLVTREHTTEVCSSFHNTSICVWICSV